MNAMDVFPEDLIAAVAANSKIKRVILGWSRQLNRFFGKPLLIREFAPVDTENFWYIRAASMLRKLYHGGTV